MSLLWTRNARSLRVVKSVAFSRSLSSISPTTIFDSLPDASSTVASEISWLPSSELRQALHALEDYTGLPLYAGIGLSCIAIRLCTVPLLVMQQRQASLLAACRPQLQYLRYLFSHDREMPFKERLATYQRTSRLIKDKYGYSRLKAWPYLLVQTPLFLGFVLSLRQVLANDAAMTEGGTLWFSDLTSKDSTFALPVVAIGLTYYTLEMAINRQTNPKQDKQNQALFPKIISWYQTALILSFPLITQMPAGVFLYWINSSLWSIAQSKILLMPSIREKLGYTDVVNSARYPNDTKTASLENVK